MRVKDGDLGQLVGRLYSAVRLSRRSPGPRDRYENPSSRRNVLSSLLLSGSDDSIEAAELHGFAALLRRGLQSNDPAFFSAYYGAFGVPVLEHHSPLKMSITLAVSSAVAAIPMFFAIEGYDIAAHIRSGEARRTLEETQVEQQREVLGYQRLQMRVLEAYVQRCAGKDPSCYPPEVLEALSKIVTPAIQELSSSPMIDAVEIVKAAKGTTSGT